MLSFLFFLTEACFINFILRDTIEQLVESLQFQGVTSLFLAGSRTSVEIDHELVSMVIPLLPLIQKGLSVTSESMCMKYF